MTGKPLCSICHLPFVPLDGYTTHPSCDLPPSAPAGYYRRLAQTRWSRTEWIEGDGRYASVSHCRITTVQLHEMAEKAKRSLAIIDVSGCGGLCNRNHAFVDLGIYL
jgi:hypothetical protein